MTALLTAGPSCPLFLVQQELDDATAPLAFSPHLRPHLRLNRQRWLIPTRGGHTVLRVNGMELEATSRAPTAAPCAPLKARVFAASKQKEGRKELPSPCAQKRALENMHVAGRGWPDPQVSGELGAANVGRSPNERMTCCCCDGAPAPRGGARRVSASVHTQFWEAPLDPRWSVVS